MLKIRKINKKVFLLKRQIIYEVLLANFLLMTWHTFIKLFYQPKRKISTYLLDSETGVKSDKLWSWESTDREGESTIDGFALDIGDDASAIWKKISKISISLFRFKTRRKQWIILYFLLNMWRNGLAHSYFCVGLEVQSFQNWTM